jgi:prephenate dehydrogenase
MNQETGDSLPHFRQLTIIGVGLIGGSVARAVRQVRLCDDIVGYGRDEGTLQTAVDLGVVDRYECDLGRAVKGADLVVVAVPLGAMADVFAGMRPFLASDAIVTDVGSAKQAVIAAARTGLAEHCNRFVPGHPIAGTEQSGVTASFAGLFEDRRVILTPLADNDAAIVTRIEQLWQYCGAKVTCMAADHHDAVLAATSHLPHLLAYALVDTLLCLDDSEEIFTYAAGGFRDFTRIASSDPVMWRDICLNNPQAILAVLDRFSGQLAELRNAISDGDEAALKTFFARAKAARDKNV